MVSGRRDRKTFTVTPRADNGTMATQTRLPTSFHLDQASREAGRRGLAKARAALAEANARIAAERRAASDHGIDDGHPAAA